MKTIYKYPIKITYHQTIDMPDGAKIIHTGVDPIGQACLWAEVQPANPAIPRSILVVGTGSLLPVGNHLGSFTQGPYVCHVYEQT